MKKLLVLTCLCVFTFLISGCATVTETPKTRCQRIQSNNCKDAKLMTEDWDRFWLDDRASLLSPHNM